MIMDQSTSMGHHLESGQTKSTFLADVLNKTLYTIITTCSKADGVRDYFHIGVLAYSGTEARNGFRGPLANDVLHSVSHIADQPLRVETRIKKVVDRNDELVEEAVKFPIWFEPQSEGKTSMCAGLRTAHELLVGWCAKHPRSFPPTVLHVTDGHPTDGDPEPLASEIRSVGTEDGACLLFNLHVDVGGGAPHVFPNDARLLADRFGQRLFRMSSSLPPHAMEAAKYKGYAVRPGARGFVFNAGIEAIADFFEIGTRASVVVDARVGHR